MTRCSSCFREYEQDFCPHCGYPETQPNAIHQLPVGTTLRGRYHIGRCLGQGGFGITYLAWDTQAQINVAVKEFFPTGAVFRDCTASTQIRCVTQDLIPHYEYSKERFLREANALAKFKDIPAIIDILDFAQENNTAYIVMEFVRGVDLAKYIQMTGRNLTAEETFRILKPVMEALAVVHRDGLVHRDISPDNIILDPVNGAKLLDFGAVRQVEKPDTGKLLTRSTETIVKHGFAPIEQYNSRGSLGPWTDEYAMCATVWYCLAGQIPPEAPLRMSEGIDPDWNALEGLTHRQKRALEKGFSLRPKDRYSSLDELMVDLFPPAAPEIAAETAPMQEPEKSLPFQTRLLSLPPSPKRNPRPKESPRAKNAPGCLRWQRRLSPLSWLRR